jgi:hypothetical protein
MSYFYYNMLYDNEPKLNNKFKIYYDHGKMNFMKYISNALLKENI